MSLGGGYSDAYQDMAAAIRDAGALLVAAAGNGEPRCLRCRRCCCCRPRSGFCYFWLRPAASPSACPPLLTVSPLPPPAALLPAACLVQRARILVAWTGCGGPTQAPWQLPSLAWTTCWQVRTGGEGVGQDRARQV